MPVSKEYLEYVLDQLTCVGEVVHKRMFGGVGFYFDGLFFGLIDDDVLYFKVNDATRPRYLKAGCSGFDPYKDGRPSIGYFSVPVEVLEDQEELRGWARDAIGVAQSAPLKKKSVSRAAAKPQRAQGAQRAKKKKR